MAVPVRTRFGLFAILAVTLAAAFTWAHLKPFWVDELLEFYSDSRPSVSAVLSGQLHAPFSLDPPAFHLLLHGMQRLAPLLGMETSTRIAPILGLLITQLCVFGLTWRLAHRSVAALLAAMLPWCMVTMDFAPEARPYSLLTACFAIALLCYHHAITAAARSRALALAGLFAALACAILTHYYGILLPLPFLTAEAARYWRNKKLDLAILPAIVLPWSVFAADIRFLHALHEFQAHYDNVSETRWRMIPLTYEYFTLHDGVYYFDHVPALLHHAVQLAAFAGIPFFLFASLRLARRWKEDPAFGTIVALCGGYLLPCINLTVAHFFTHTYALRYSLPTVAALAVLLPLLLNDIQPRPALSWSIVAGLSLLSLAFDAGMLTLMRHRRQTVQSEATIAPALRSVVLSSPDPHIYIQDMAKFLALHFYLSEADGPLLLGTYSPELELALRHRTRSGISARNMSRSTELPIVPFDQLQQQPGPHFLVVYNDPAEEWINLQMGSGELTWQPAGSALGGELYRVTFTPSTPRPLPDAQ